MHPRLTTILQIPPPLPLPLPSHSRPHTRRRPLRRTFQCLPNRLILTKALNRLLRHMNLQARHYAPGVHTQCMQSLAAIPPLDLVREVDVCGLGLSVRGPGAVATILEVVVPELDACGAMTHGGEGDDAGAEVLGGGGEEGGLEQLEKQEVREVVGAELAFKAVGCVFERGRCHDAGVVYEDVQGLAFG